ncbi:transcriptional regulator, DeoR family [Actinokineospora alba]|uniref:Lactose phosphotransferase system repressor n=1 Tax=Actinokineospora alba TaxID=504798 RepID=A0A1H0K2I5_9PSEU|nr:DeoR/GlpR family DNA-binding transcription regulator [Actinokineospora alba]TDP68072.1 DeoR family transcriptional regulator [Actinokineospora alba]SDH91882.1 DeoR family transcriptional regulator, fructose operon transcriptional repressor [Actinokineospora alba]SDO50106.1 transcriptional regulator, DeoR family [Actinokineospora alba]
MYAAERQQLIADRARAAGRVEVAGLAEDLGVTTETVRRDLDALEKHGVLRRVHGGAIPVERLRFEPELAARDAESTGEKQRIAKAALAELPAEGVILLDAGSTTARLAELVPADRDLTVVTNALPIALALANRGVNVLCLGGRVRPKTLAGVDTWALNALRDLYVDVAFVGTNGLTADRGLSTPDQAEAAVKSAMVTAARRVVVLTDSSKVGTECFARFATLDQVDVIVTDDRLSDAEAAEFEAAGPTVVRA